MRIEGPRRREGQDEGRRDVQDEPPPLLGRWRTVYKAVLCYLALLIAGLYALTRMFRY